MLRPRFSHSRRWRVAIALGITLIAGAGTAKEQSPAPLSRFAHVTLTTQQGAPPGIRAMAQAPDGMIWLGARDGLWRFDGTTFDHIPAPHGARFAEAPVSSLLVSRRGELWVGFGASGGVAVYRHGHLVDAGLSDPPPQIVYLTQGPDDAIWAQWGGIDKRLWRFAAGRWALMDKALGLPPGYGLQMRRRRDGSLWLPVMSPEQDGAGLAELRPGTNRFRWHPGHFDYPALAEDRQGRLWVSDRKAIRPVDGDGKPLDPSWQAVPGTGLPTLTFDSHGGLWSTTRTKGLLHIAASADPASRAERLDAQSGLSSDQTHVTLEDRHGTIWIATEEGLDRFSLPAVTFDPVIRTSPIDGIAFSRTGDGAVHIINHGDLYDIPLNAPPRLRMHLARETTLCEAGDGALWLADTNAMFRLEGRGKRDIARLPVHMPFGCLRDSSGRSWVLGEDHKVWWQDRAGWHPAGQGQNLLLPGAGLRSDARGAVAFADGLDAVTLVTGDAFRRIALAPLKLGRLRGIDTAGDGFLLTMEMGLVRLRGGRMAVLRVKDQPWLQGLRTVVRGSRGESWFYSPGRLVLVQPGDLAAGFDHPQRPVPHRLLGAADGIPGAMQHPGFIGPQALAGGDERLWLATASGMAVLDPRALPAPEPAPSVQVSALEAGNVMLRDPEAPVLPPGSSTIRLAYASPGDAAPETLRFRFRLEGVEDDWVQAENRRATTYTNLAPGDYRFHVQAARGDTGWGPESVLHVSIRPSFVQDWPFKLLCAACVLLVLWLAYHARMRAVAAHIRLRLEERHDERERIARELHDTLLQSIQGLILHVEAATQDLPPREKARAALEHALDNAQDAVVDLREKVESCLQQFAREVLRDTLPCRIMVVGTPCDLSPLAAHELSRIAREVLFNALRHARASQMLVAIGYRWDRLDLRFADNGVGADPAMLSAGGREGHFGLLGLHERVRTMQGRITMANGAEGGLATTIIIPARTAYAEPQGLLRRLVSWLRED
jgi:ligand-binding sensor domain-containing protein